MGSSLPDSSNLYLVMVPHELERLHCKLDL